MTYQIVCADVMEWTTTYDGPKFHALLCDPPYELNFMGRVWDRSGIPFQPETWAALAEHLLPGGFVMAFGSSRTSHRLACAMEDAGMVLQPQVFVWATGSSFPKATRIDTKIDEAAGMLGEREIGTQKWADRYPNGPGGTGFHGGPGQYSQIGRGPEYEMVPATPLARAWEGHRYGGQILRDNATPIVVAQKPWTDPRLDCIVETGAGAMWIEGSRISANHYNQDHDVVSYKHCVLRGTQALCEPPSVLPESPLDFLYNIVSALRYYNSDGKALEHNAFDLDDSPPGEFLYARTIHDRLYPNGAWCGLDLTLALNSQDDCPNEFRFGDEQLREIQGAARGGAPLLADALEHIYQALSESLRTRASDSAHRRIQTLVVSLCDLLLSRLDSIIPYTKPHVNMGRWPSNFALVHNAPSACPDCNGDGCQACGGSGLVGGCRRVGVKRVKGTNTPSGISLKENVGYGGGWGDREANHYNDPDGLETIDAWECEPDCPARRLGEQSGVSVSRPHRCKVSGPSGWANNSRGEAWSPHNDTGTAARFFFQADWRYEIAERLAAADPVRYCAKASRGEREAGLDKTEIVMVQLSHNSKAGGALWEKEDLRARLLVDMELLPPKVIGASMLQENDAIEWNTFLFGSNIKGKSLLATTSITLTGTNLITESKTLQFLMHSLTNACTQDVNLEKVNGGSPVENAEKSNPSLSFINAEAVSLPGVGNVASGTQWKISVDVKQGGRCFHPTVKPISLCKWLATLLLPPGEYAPRRIMVPFAGSGSEMIAAVLTDWEEVVGIELQPEYVEIARARVHYWATRPRQLELDL